MSRRLSITPAPSSSSSHTHMHTHTQTHTRTHTQTHTLLQMSIIHSANKQKSDIRIKP